MDTPFDFRPVAATVADLVRRVGDEQLGQATPNAGRTVADLLDHIDGLALAFTLSARKEPLPGGGNPSADGSRLGDDWRERIAERLTDLAEAWSDPAAYTGSTMAGPIEMSGADAALVALDEVTVHGWDLARATGQPYDPDPAAVAACREFVASFDPPADGSLFAAPVAVPDDASDLDKLIGATGRDPAWNPAS